MASVCGLLGQLHANVASAISYSAHSCGCTPVHAGFILGQSALRRAFAWKTGNDMHCAVSRNSALRVRHNDDVICYI